MEQDHGIKRDSIKQMRFSMYLKTGVYFLEEHHKSLRCPQAISLTLRVNTPTCSFTWDMGGGRHHLKSHSSSESLAFGRGPGLSDQEERSPEGVFSSSPLLSFYPTLPLN